MLSAGSHTSKLIKNYQQTFLVMANQQSTQKLLSDLEATVKELKEIHQNRANILDKVAKKKEQIKNTSSQ
ncbi:hypothetical protein [Eisenibacter elegans]|uniref:hypothetical protein n=1 Tax=Eisenibacter elegans TaxID=997 RepID=UPI00137676DC|nr:hypothetical protein [Eisenibacter elegans]